MPEFAPIETFEVGEARITYLPDGKGISEPMALFPTSSQIEWSMHSQHLDADGMFRTTLGAFLVEVGDRRIMVDTGIGPVKLEFEGFGTYEGGQLPDSLAQTGVAPADVTDVVFTHLHVDHVGWTTVEQDGERRLLFPNARYWVSEAEWQHWHGGDDPAGPDPEAVQRPLEDRIGFVTDGDEIAPGVKVEATPGHTPGHISLVVSSGELRAIIVGDLMYGAIQVERYEWAVAFDADPALAEETRRAMLREFVLPDTTCAAGHFTDSVFGRLLGTGLGMVWRPPERQG